MVSCGSISSLNNINIHQNPSCPELVPVVMQPVPYTKEEPGFNDHARSLDTLPVATSLLPSAGEYNMENCLINQMMSNLNPQNLEGVEFLCENIFYNWKLGSNIAGGMDYWNEITEIESLVPSPPPPVASSCEGHDEPGSSVQLPEFK